MEEGATRGPCPKDLTTRVLSEIRSQHKFDTVDFSNDRGDPHLATDVVLKKLEPLVMVKYGPFLGSCCPLTSKSNSNLSSLPPPPSSPIDHSSERIIGESTSSGPTSFLENRPICRPTDRSTDNEINSTPSHPSPSFPKFHTTFDVWNNYMEGEREREKERREKKSWNRHLLVGHLVGEQKKGVPPIHGDR